jgi:curli biogenesis system outer membrane secretion channel CsgG
MLALAACTTDPLPSASAVAVEEEDIPLPPRPPRALTASTYNCIDTSGQRRPSTTIQELSTAVPQDCTPYLIEAVRSLTPGYLNLVERQHVDELLRERQIATLALNNGAQTAAAQTAAAAAAAHAAAARKLATLKVAEVLLVGQVVAYDRSTRQVTGGIALGGNGVTGQFVTDLISFSLRAVAVQTGEVLGESSVTKSVTSLQLGGTIVKIFSASIINAELGGATNEPIGLALRAAVRGALTQLINHGIHDGWWA